MAPPWHPTFLRSSAALRSLRRPRKPVLLLHVVVKGSVRLERLVTYLAKLWLFLCSVVTPGCPLVGPSSRSPLAHLHVLLQSLDTLAHGATFGTEQTHQLRPCWGSPCCWKCLLPLHCLLLLGVVALVGPAHPVAPLAGTGAKAGSLHRGS